MSAHEPRNHARPVTGRHDGAADGADASAHGDAAAGSFALELHWIPLGAGQHVVRLSGWMFERLASTVQRRPPCDLYHSALTLETPEDRYVIEMTPVPRRGRDGRGVVVEGTVGFKPLGRLRVFRYEVRCWRGGTIPDLDAAVATDHIGLSEEQARRLVDQTAHVPPMVWGRDEFRAGEMWNSNSVVSWLLATTGVDTSTLAPPSGGRAPGWDAGLVVARRRLRSG